MAVVWEEGGADDQPKLTTRKIHRLQPNSACDALILGKPLAVWLHWVDGSALPHMARDCAWCTKSKKFRRWYAPAAVPVERHDPDGRTFWKWLPVVLELNAECVAELSGKKCDALLVSLHRATGRRSPLTLKVSPVQEGSNKWKWFDVRPVLEAIWDLDQGEIGSGGEEGGAQTLPFRGRSA